MGVRVDVYLDNDDAWALVRWAAGDGAWEDAEPAITAFAAALAGVQQGFGEWSELCVSVERSEAELMLAAYAGAPLEIADQALSAVNDAVEQSPYC